MDFLTFVTKVFEAWAWPITVLSVAAWFREPLVALLPRLLFKLPGGVEASFREEIKELAAAGIPNFVQPVAAEPLPTLEESETQPVGTVMASWKALELAAAQLYRVAVDPNAPEVDPIRGVATLLERRFIDAREEDMFVSLYKLRNSLTDNVNATITAPSALTFARLATQLTNSFRAKASLWNPAAPQQQQQ